MQRRVKTSRQIPRFWRGLLLITNLLVNMKIYADQLINHLYRTLSPVYMIAGEELLLIQEAEEAISTAAQKANVSESIKFTIDSGFDWSLFQKSAENRSLFSDKQAIYLDLSAKKISDAGKKILVHFLQKSHLDKLLILRVGKLDAALQKTSWYKAAEKIGVVVPVWPLSSAQLLTWIQQRLNKVGLKIDQEGLQLLAMRTEGNLLATAQEIEKLSLLFPASESSPIGLKAEEIEEATSNNARFNVFSLIDAILENQPVAIVRILKTLETEGSEAILVLWVLRREAHQWAKWVSAIQNGQSLVQILTGNFMLEKRRPLIERALKKQTLENLYGCLQHAAHIDQVIKGAQPGAVWHELCILALSLVGMPVNHLQQFPPPLK